MTQSKHTPTPWDALQVCDEITIIRKHEGTERYEPIAEIVRKSNYADAAFIVKAVNCHEELVAALKYMDIYLDNLVRVGGEKKFFHDKIKSVLAKAKE